MNTIEVPDLATIAVNLRRAWDIKRACRPTWESPISPSSSARGTRAATESMTTTSIEFERTNISAISRACSPLSGWETSKLSMSTPSFCAYSASRACSASMKAAVPPAFWAWAMIDKDRVVLPEDSGPKTSMTRPRGTPPMPMAKSTASEPVGIAAMPRISCWPRRMMAPLPNWRSIWPRVFSSARTLSRLGGVLLMSRLLQGEERSTRLGCAAGAGISYTRPDLGSWLGGEELRVIGIEICARQHPRHISRSASGSQEA